MAWKYYKVGPLYTHPALERDHARSNGCTCGRAPEYSSYYDAHFCATCNRWIDATCGDRTCEHCGERPWRPRQAAPWRLRA